MQKNLLPFSDLDSGWTEWNHHYTPGFVIDEVKEDASEENLDQEEDDVKIESSSGWGRTSSADDNILRNVLRAGKRERTISEVQNTKHSIAVPSIATNNVL